MTEQVIQEFKKLLDSHDWWYEKSDDYRVYKAGLRHAREITYYLHQHKSPVLDQMYRDACPYQIAVEECLICPKPVDEAHSPYCSKICAIEDQLF